MAAKYKILYLEDNPSDIDLLTTHFQEYASNFSVEIAVTGAECLKNARQNKYDLILLDNKLPDVDGIDILKELVVLLPTVPMIMITGKGDEELVINAIRIGAASYVSKSDSFLNNLPSIMQQFIEEYKDRTLALNGHYPTRRRVLYIEKSRTDIDLTSEHFRNCAKPITIETAETSADAFVLLKEESEFDLILIDLRLTDMNALDFIKELKFRKINIPVIVVTGKGDEKHAVAAIHLGAYDYIVKRNDYLVQLPYAIYNAIDKFNLNQANQKLLSDLTKINQELESKNAALERLNNAFVEREIRIKELRDDVERLTSLLKK